MWTRYGASAPAVRLKGGRHNKDIMNLAAIDRAKFHMFNTAFQHRAHPEAGLGTNGADTDSRPKRTRGYISICVALGQQTWKAMVWP